MVDKNNKSTNNKIIGKVILKENKYCFEAKNGDFFNIAQDEIAKRLAYSGEICILEVSDFRTQSIRNIGGEIIEIIGKEGDPIPEGLAIAKVHNLTTPFSDEALDETSKMPINVTSEQWQGFRDLRHINFVTIDPDNAKDFDDAVYAEKNEDGTYTFMGAIANVANYIDKDREIYKEILSRGTSSYLGSTVYPMLPEKISNVLCSLNEKEDRVVMCTTAKIAPDGTILEYSIEPAVINSKHRLTYKQADFIQFGHCEVVDDQSIFKGLVAQTLDVKPSINALFELSDILTKQRKSRGAIDITSFKPHFVLDRNGTNVIAVEEEHCEKSTKVIESTAILINEISGEIAKKIGLPTIYRNHSLPDDMSAKILNDKLNGVGYNLPEIPTAESYIKLLRLVKGKKIEEIVTSMVLKSFKEAYYSGKNDGHFGLGIKINEFYDMFMYENGDLEKVANDARSRYFRETGSHNGLKFDGDLSHSSYAYSTSPIRNAPSYIIQAQLLNYILNGNILYDEKKLDDLARKFSDLERNASQAEKEYDNLLGSIWAKEHIGESVDGRIVCFYPDGILLKTLDPKNISITLPYEEIRSASLTTQMIEKMLVKCGVRHKSQHKGQQSKQNKNNCPLQLGDTLENLLIYYSTSTPPRVYVTENKQKYLDNFSNQERQK